MEDAAKIETAALDESINFAPRVGYSARPLIPAALYLLAYFAIAWGVRFLGSTGKLDAFGLTTGLNLALLISYGLWYAPVVATAIAADGLWLHPLSWPFPLAELFCLSAFLIQLGAAAIVRRFCQWQRVPLKTGRDVVKFIGVGAVLSLSLGVAAVLLRHVTLGFEWKVILGELHTETVSYAVGIFCLSPFLLIHVAPWLETALFGLRSKKQDLLRNLQSIIEQKHTTMFAFSFVCLAVLALYAVTVGIVVQNLYVFLLLSAPLIWVACMRGLEGLSIAVPVMLLMALGFTAHMPNVANSADMLPALLVIASVNAYGIAAGVTENRITENEVQRRNAILDAVSYAARHFLRNAGWEAGVQEVVKRLGEATLVTRVFLIDNRVDRLGGQIGDASIYEWSERSLTSDENEKRILYLLRRQLIKEASSGLSTGHPFLFRTKDFPRKQQEMLCTLGIRSGIIIPLFVDRQWWGCLGLEQCFVDRDWVDSEVGGLQMAGQILGTLIASIRVEQQFRQLIGNVQAVFWISSPDGRGKQYVSPGYEEIWGASCASLQKNPSSWLQSIHPEDRTRVIDSLVKQSWGEYDEEYRVLRPDGSIRWVRDRAFPVRDQTGAVYRIVGIAEDITKQKVAEDQLRAATEILSGLINHLYSGILVEDDMRRITHVNQSFKDMFNIPVSVQSLSGVDSRLLFPQAKRFSDRIEEIIRDGTAVIGEEIEWQGRLFLRNYVPLSIADRRYHLWQYRDITESRQAEEQIRASLKEKEVLLKEIHHRVKNNLQIISSLLNLQSAEIQDPKAAQKFRESQDRVKAMALIHERLYQSSDLARIDFAGYVRNLTGHLQRSYRVDASIIRLNLEINPVPMSLDVAIPCGLIINELVSNAFKYAFPGGKSGEILVRFVKEKDGSLKLLVRDSGVGLPEGTHPEYSDSLGLKLVRSLTEQMGGEVRYRSQGGFSCEIHIPCTKVLEVQ